MKNILLALAISTSCITTAQAQNLNSLEKDSGGRLGVAATIVGSDKKLLFNENAYFPMQSVFKLPLAIYILKQVDSGRIKLDDKMTVKREQLSVLYSPLADDFKKRDWQTHPYTIRELLTTVIQTSDNTACDLLLTRYGGAGAVQNMLTSNGIKDMRVSRLECELQPDIIGLPRTGYKSRENWQSKSAKATGARARHAFEHYMNADRQDHTTPSAMLRLLDDLVNYKLLSRESTDLLLTILHGTSTAPDRLQAALPPGAALAHKTGTGPDLCGVNSATNDVGIITLADKRKVLIAVFTTGSRLNEKGRDATVRDAAKFVFTNCEKFDRN